jgi:uncharacterized damage-inducible protein DinB
MKPQPQDYSPFYATYINQLPDGDIADILAMQMETTYELLNAIPAQKEAYAYADGKWTIKQVVGHMIDTERIMVYRALRFARNDAQELRGFDQDEYVAESRANERGLADLALEFNLMRQANLYFFNALNDTELQRSGAANGAVVTVNALLHIVAGHELHHIKILKERYLS